MGQRSATAASADGRPEVGRPRTAGEVARPVARRGTGPAPLPPTGAAVRFPELIVGVLVVVGCALAAVLWHTSSTATRRALVLAGPVERGHVLQDSDFAAADVSATGMRLIAFEERAGMVGRIVVADLAAATPITDSVAVATVPLGDGEGLVGRRLVAGEYPAGLAPDAKVQVILVVESEASPDASPTKKSLTLDTVAVVDDVSPLANTADAVVVSLRLPADLARQVAAADGVRLVQVGS